MYAAKAQQNQQQQQHHQSSAGTSTSTISSSQIAEHVSSRGLSASRLKWVKNRCEGESFVVSVASLWFPYKETLYSVLHASFLPILPTGLSPDYFCSAF